MALSILINAETPISLRVAMEETQTKNQLEFGETERERERR